MLGTATAIRGNRISACYGRSEGQPNDVSAIAIAYAEWLVTSDVPGCS
jgi:hypothetical protein